MSSPFLRGTVEWVSSPCPLAVTSMNRFLPVNGSLPDDNFLRFLILRLYMPTTPSFTSAIDGGMSGCSTLSLLGILPSVLSAGSSQKKPLEPPLETAGGVFRCSDAASPTAVRFDLSAMMFWSTAAASLNSTSGFSESTSLRGKNSATMSRVQFWAPFEADTWSWSATSCVLRNIAPGLTSFTSNETVPIESLLPTVSWSNSSS
mmetsp:Transcript_94504/g.270561  ORF Transcript_94504/g.270561 Transcript_94504/m.270561 type:complete len:204 (-) Transcript_94504:797-1408(-)